MINKGLRKWHSFCIALREVCRRLRGSNPAFGEHIMKRSVILGTLFGCMLSISGAQAAVISVMSSFSGGGVGGAELIDDKVVGSITQFTEPGTLTLDIEVDTGHAYKINAIVLDLLYAETLIFEPEDGDPIGLSGPGSLFAMISPVEDIISLDIFLGGAAPWLAIGGFKLEIIEMPVPGGALLLGSALAGAGLIRRRSMLKANPSLRM
ncbi:MAG: hypothetical protein AAF862_12540 [Pseudomonadota bacterium]